MSWSDNIRNSIHNESKWKASILFPTSYASQFNNILSLTRSLDSHSINVTVSSSFDTNKYVDIVDLFDMNNSSLYGLIDQISLVNSYPNNAIFHFEGYETKDDREPLASYIKSSAFKSGTILNSTKSYNKSEKTKAYNFTLTCAHYGNYDGAKEKSNRFVDGKLQMCGTIKQTSHSASSIKNRSRNSCFSRVNNSTNSFEDKCNRSSTKKCGCTFQLTAFFDDSSNRWFLKTKRPLNSSHMYHINHMFIDPKFLSMSKYQLPSAINEAIESLIQVDGNISTVIAHIKQRFNVNVNYGTVYSIRSKFIDQLIHICNDKPYGSSVDKLITLFKSMNNVSFVYVIHRYDSGFVTYRKNKSDSYSGSYTEYNTNNDNSFCHIAIKNWRDEL